MADFVQTAVSKSAQRVLRNQIGSLSALENLIADITTNNPWSCVPYIRSGVTMPPVDISARAYTGKVKYQDTMGKVIGEITVKTSTNAGFTTALSEVEQNADLEAAMGGIPAHDPMTDKWSIALRCCAAGGDLYTVTFTRDTVRVTSYIEDSLLATIETWADGIAILD